MLQLSGRNRNDEKLICLIAFAFSLTYVDILTGSRPLPARGRHFASCPLPSAQACPKRYDAHQKNHKGKESEQKKATKERRPAPYIVLVCDAMKEARGNSIEVLQTPSYFRRAYFATKYDGKNKRGFADSVVFSVVLIFLAALKSVVILSC